ncbi:MAG: FliM/FliN family flagellar motor C-terminal domain-containing protein [bacterium]
MLQKSNKLSVRLDETFISSSDISNLDKNDIILSNSTNSGPFNLYLNEFLIGQVHYTPIYIDNNLYYSFYITKIFPKFSRDSYNCKEITDVFITYIEIVSINGIDIRELEGIGKNSIIIADKKVTDCISFYCNGYKTGEGHPVIHHKGKIEKLGIKIDKIISKLELNRVKKFNTNNCIKPNNNEYENFLNYTFKEPSVVDIKQMNIFFEIHQRFLNSISKKENNNYKITQLEEINNNKICEEISKSCKSNNYKINIVKMFEEDFNQPLKKIFIPDTLTDIIDEKQKKFIKDNYFRFNKVKNRNFFSFLIITEQNKNDNEIELLKYAGEIEKLWKEYSDKNITFSIENLKESNITNNFNPLLKSLKIVMENTSRKSIFFLIYPHSTVKALFE